MRSQHNNEIDHFMSVADVPTIDQSKNSITNRLNTLIATKNEINPRDKLHSRDRFIPMRMISNTGTVSHGNKAPLLYVTKLFVTKFH